MENRAIQVGTKTGSTVNNTKIKQCDDLTDTNKEKNEFNSRLLDLMMMMHTSPVTMFSTQCNDK